MEASQIKMTTVSIRLTDVEKRALNIIAQEEDYEFAGDLLRDMVIESKYGDRLSKKAAALKRAKKERQIVHNND
jgi:predicted transcriptional regulator